MLALDLEGSVRVIIGVVFVLLVRVYVMGGFWGGWRYWVWLGAGFRMGLKVGSILMFDLKVGFGLGLRVGWALGME